MSHAPTARRVLATLLLTLSAVTASAGEPPWETVREGGHVVLLRHALAPGTGDPPGFELGDCSTQRNLSAAGREQARRIGEQLRAVGLGGAPVYTSQWCRCRETAELLGLTAPEPLRGLNSFFGRYADREPTLQALRGFLRGRDEAPTAVLVTHQVNITATTDVFPASGQAVVARVAPDGGLTTVGTVPPPPTRAP